MLNSHGSRATAGSTGAARRGQMRVFGLMASMAGMVLLAGCGSAAQTAATPGPSTAIAPAVTPGPASSLAPASSAASPVPSVGVVSPVPSVGVVSPVPSVVVVSPVARASAGVVLTPLPTLTPGPVVPEAPATPVVVHVGETSGEGDGVYLYYSPTTGNRIQSYPPGTELLVIGGDVEGDGLTWHYVRAPDGTEGYVPVGDTVSPDEAQ
jgi:hypothetical protein